MGHLLTDQSAENLGLVNVGIMCMAEGWGSRFRIFGVIFYRHPFLIFLCFTMFKGE